jgi:hypothetical protein
MSAVTVAIKRVLPNSNKWLLATAGAACLALPVASRADDNGRGRDDRGRFEKRYNDRRDNNWRDDSRDIDRRYGRDIDVDIRISGRQPEYRTREVRVWVPPVYRTVVDRKWVEPVYRTETRRVWVPDRYEDREVCDGPRWRRRTHIERVLVVPAHYETREARICVSEGHWENCERQELVSAGHYEVRVERVREPYRMSPFQVVNPSLAGINIGLHK